MEKLPLVSIITYSYNQGEFVEGAILSVKNQDYPNIEHIIVDGASTDNTLDVIKKYEGTYNMQWVSEPDDGPVEAINKGLRKAHGDILGLLPADDLQLPWTASVAVEYLNRHLDVELIYGDMLHMNLKTGMNRLSFFPKVSLQFLRRSGFVPSIAAFFRKSVVEKVGLPDENLKAGSDYEYWIRVAGQCKVLKIEEFLAVDRIHPKSRRVRLRQAIRKESRRVRHGYGMPKGMMRYPFRIADLVRAYMASRFLRVKLAFYYWTKVRKASSRDSMTYPWQNLIEFPGFHVVSWFGFLIMMLPWTSKRYKKNWFVLDLGEHYEKAPGKYKVHHSRESNP